MPLVSRRELKRRFELEGPKKTSEHILAALREEHLKPEDFSIRDLAEATIPDGVEYVRSICDQSMQGSESLQVIEAAGAVDTSAFVNITGQIVYTEIRKQFDMPEFIGGQLARTVPTRFNGEKIPGVSGLGDNASTVVEGKGYPYVGVTEEYIQTPATTKRGFIVPVTKEALFFDRTAEVLNRCRDVGYWLALNKEKRIIAQATGLQNAGTAVASTYNRNGTLYATYNTSGAWVNDIASGNALTDWTKIETVMLNFDALTDPNTGEVIMVMPKILLVPTALRFTAKRIVDALEVDYGSNTTNTPWNLARSANPVGGMFQVLSSPLIKKATNDSTMWFLGDFQRAFSYMENWPITVTQAPANSEMEFTHDIVARFKASERGVATASEPRYVGRSKA